MILVPILVQIHDLDSLGSLTILVILERKKHLEKVMSSAAKVSK